MSLCAGNAIFGDTYRSLIGWHDSLVLQFSTFLAGLDEKENLILTRTQKSTRVN